MKLFSFKGGVHPPYHKELAAEQPIAQAPMPERLAVPLHQHIGGVPHPLVNEGEKVLKGQRIGDADGWISAAVHAPTSGTVLEIGLYAANHPSGLSTPAVLIEPDGEDRWLERKPVDYQRLSPESVREALRDAGVVGLGGAAFPSHAKLAAAKATPVETLVINGAECEPYITCDDRLMRECPDEIVEGAAIFQELLEAKQVIFGIEDNKPQAITALEKAIAACGRDYRVVSVPTIYPTGGVKQLIRVITGKEAPATILPPEMGVQCFNVATAWGACRALAHGEPLVSRVVTLCGNVDKPRNWQTLIGTPIDEMLALAETLSDTDGIIVGGPMMGFRLPDWSAPVTKGSNCLIATSPSLFPPSPPESPCIRCGECAKVCPHELQPFELYWHSRSKNFGRAQEYHIFDCIECGCCSYICPAHIPLVQYFRFAKSEIREREREKRSSEAAKARYEFRQFRTEREKAERAERLTRASAAQAEKIKAAKAADSGEAQPGVSEAARPASNNGIG